MTLRLVPRFKSQIRQISDAQKCVGKGVSDGKRLAKVRNGVTILSILMTWAFENSIETADSMKARGYGLSGRTSFSFYKLNKRSLIYLFTLSLLAAVIITGAFTGLVTTKYFPTVEIRQISLPGLIIYTAYILFLTIPLILNIKESIKWTFIKSRI